MLPKYTSRFLNQSHFTLLKKNIDTNENCNFRKITNPIYLVFCLNLKYRPNNNFLQFMYLDEEFSLEKFTEWV